MKIGQNKGFAWVASYGVTGFAGFLHSLFSLAFPSLVVKMSLYPLVQGGYFHMKIYFQLSGGTEEGQRCFLQQLFLNSP